MAVATAFYSHQPVPQHYEPPSPIERQLIDYSKTFIDLLNRRAYNHPFFTDHVSQNVYVDFQGHCSRGLGPFIYNYKQDADRSPGFHVDASINGTALVDEDAGSATVILSQHITGFQDEYRGIEKAGTILMSWRRGRGRWCCGSVTMIHGTPEFLV